MTLDEIRTEMDAFYSGFPCLLCEGKNHKFFSITKTGNGTVTYNAEWCRSTLKNH